MAVSFFDCVRGNSCLLIEISQLQFPALLWNVCVVENYSDWMLLCMGLLTMLCPVLSSKETPALCLTTDQGNLSSCDTMWSIETYAALISRLVV